MVFGFSIGINVRHLLTFCMPTDTHLLRQVTNAVFVQLPPPLGYGFSQFATAGIYGTPIVRLITAHAT